MRAVGAVRDVTVADLQKGRQDDLELLPPLLCGGLQGGGRYWTWTGTRSRSVKRRAGRC